MISDETLYRSYLDGDESGLKSLMERHGSSLTFYINGYLHDIHDAEDLMIEAFTRMIIKHPCLREGGFKAYLYKTARHLALRFLAKNKLHCCFGLDGFMRFLKILIPKRKKSLFRRIPLLQ